jgi:hypothetical protein
MNKKNDFNFREITESSISIRKSISARYLPVDELTYFFLYENYKTDLEANPGVKPGVHYF